MKLKLALFVGLVFSTISVSSQNDPIIMTIGGEPIYKSEFEYIYNKNNTNTSLDKKSLDEYVTLFINFKMKVMEAKQKGLAEKPSYEKELKTYDDQLTAPYLIDNVMEDSLIREAYNRMQEEVTASHILVKIKGTDTISAYRKINAIYDKLKAGADFATFARDSSDCPSSRQGGFLGMVTPFSTVYPFECVVYNTEVGQISKPFRTEFGYHIVRVQSRKPARDEIRISHIYKRQSETSKSQIDSLYQLLQNGAKFDDLAKQSSDDKESAYKGGDLGWLVSGRYPEVLENAARQLKKKGDISPVVMTPFGYHILYLSDKRAKESYEERYADIKNKVERDSRSAVISQSSIDKLALKYNLTQVEGGLDAFYDIAKDSLSYVQMSNRCRNLDAPLFIMNGEYFAQSDFVESFKREMSIYDSERKEAADLNNNKKSAYKLKYDHYSPVEFVDAAFYDFCKTKLIELEKQTLLREHDDYRNLLREYSDGLLLFDISNSEVWNRASSDDEGLSQFFEENKANYKWETPRYKGKIVYCADSLSMVAAKKLLKTVSVDSFDIKARHQLNVAGEKKIKIENGLYAKGTNKLIDNEIFNLKTTYTNDKYPFAFCVGKLVNEPESFKDVKGPVTADYQNYLEDRWVAQLRKKYNVVIFQDVLKTVKK